MAEPGTLLGIREWAVHRWRDLRNAYIALRVSFITFDWKILVARNVLMFHTGIGPRNASKLTFATLQHGPVLINPMLCFFSGRESDSPDMS